MVPVSPAISIWVCPTSIFSLLMPGLLSRGPTPRWHIVPPFAFFTRQIRLEICPQRCPQLRTLCLTLFHHLSTFMWLPTLLLLETKLQCTPLFLALGAALKMAAYTWYCWKVTAVNTCTGTGSQKTHFHSRQERDEPLGASGSPRHGALTLQSPLAIDFLPDKRRSYFEGHFRVTCSGGWKSFHAYATYSHLSSVKPCL